MKSKTLIDKQLQRKRNPELVETLMAAKKNDSWLEVAGVLSGPSRKRVEFNLNDLNKEEGNVVIPGKVLSQGNVDKKMKVIALNFSEKAKEKLSKAGCETSSILEEIKSNPSAEGVRILK